MNTPAHPELAAGKWCKMSLFEQLGNVASEVGRAIKWHKINNAQRFDGAFARALELLDLTRNDARWRGSRRKELSRAREVFCDYFFGGNQYSSTADSLERYFMQYAYAARNEKEKGV